MKIKKKKSDSSSASRQSNSISLVDEAIRKAEVQIAKGKRTGQEIGSVRTPAGGAKKK